MEINIPASVQDPYYRYTRPVADISVNSKYTIIKNIAKIAKSLNRPESQILRYLSLRIGARSTDGGISAKVDLNQLEDYLETYISNYVLCGECHNPETIYVNRKFLKECKACGHKSGISCKYANKIIKSDTTRKKAKMDTPKESHWDDDWSLPTDKDSVKNRRPDR